MSTMLDASDVIAALATSNSAVLEGTAPSNPELETIESSSIAASLEDNSGEVTGCGGGGCLAVA